LRLLAQLDDDERQRLMSQIVSDPAAPLHGDLDMLLKACLHAMKSAVRVFVACRDRPSDGGHLWAADHLRQLKARENWTWGKFYQQLVELPEARRAVKLLSPDYRGGELRLLDRERIRAAIRNLERHAKMKSEKADAVYQLTLAALPPGLRAAFPGIESYLRLY
jgi:hypothetical protein